MKPLKQPSLDQLFRLYPQLRAAEADSAQGSQMPPDFLRNGALHSEHMAASSHPHGEQN